MVRVKELSCARRGLKNIIVVIVIIIQTGVENKSYWLLQVIFFAVWGQRGRAIGREPASQRQIFPLLFKPDRAVPIETGPDGNLGWHLIHPSSISQADSLQLGGMKL